jgi:pimeloyl-ACP methyl ester carboxylesterase
MRPAAAGVHACADLLHQGDPDRRQAAGGVDAVLAGRGVDLHERERAADLGAWLLEGVLEGLRPGPWGWVDDCVALARPWGFDLGAVTCPVLLEHGLADGNVPVSHGRALAAAIPGASLTEHDAEGHLPDPEGMLRRVLAAAGRG